MKIESLKNEPKDFISFTNNFQQSVNASKWYDSRKVIFSDIRVQSFEIGYIDIR